MKKYLSLIIGVLLLSFTTATAQYVTIPDSAFRSQLIKYYPSCFNSAGQMDTTCSAIVNEDSLNFSSGSLIGSIDNSMIYSIKGIKYFKNLQLLYMNSGGGLKTISEWPPNLKYIYIGDCGLDSLPNNFPDSLVSFEFIPNGGSDYIYHEHSFPPFPSTLVKFAVYSIIKLTQLPALPQSLKYLFIQGSQLVSLPTLPNGLEYLEVRGFPGQMQHLPSLPKGLKYLGCADHLLDTLPPLPDSLRNLSVGGNKLLKHIPTLPGHLDSLICWGDSSLTSLPPLPGSLDLLDVYNSGITCLPVLPNNLK